MWFIHDDAARFSTVMRKHFDATHPGKWIGRGGHATWPPRSLDLSPLDFFFWGYLKSFAYQTPVGLVGDLTDRIAMALADISSTWGVFEHVQQFLVRRSRLCRDLHGRNFLQILEKFLVVFFLTLNYDEVCSIILLYIK